MPIFLAAFFDADGPWADIAQVLWVLQLALIIHVYKTGRPFWWIYILFIAPAIGGLAYLFIELLPEWRVSRGRLWKTRALRIRKLRAELEETDNVNTRLAQAHELLEAGKPREALEMLGRVNTKNDKMLDLDVAVMRGRALFATGQHREAQAQMESVQTRYSGEEPRYFLALALKATGRKEEARQLLEDIVKKFRRAGRAWRRSERHWFRLAAARLKELKA